MNLIDDFAPISCIILSSQNVDGHTVVKCESIVDESVSFNN